MLVGNVDKVTLEWWINHAKSLEKERDRLRNRVNELESEVRRLETENSKHC
jgi:ubiquinone biosynthesis protein UbiJ